MLWDSFVKLMQLDRYDFDQVEIKVSTDLPNYHSTRGGYDYTEAKVNRFMRSGEPIWIISDSPIEIEVHNE